MCGTRLIVRNGSLVAVMVFVCGVLTIPARTDAAEQQPSRWTGVSNILEDLDVGLARFSGCVSSRQGKFILATGDGGSGRTYALKGNHDDLARAAGQTVSVHAVRVGGTMLVRSVRVVAATCGD